MKKIIFFAAMVGVAFTSCMNEEFIGDQEALNAAGERPIEFGFELKNATRAGGEDAATALGNQFIVYGEKNEDASIAPGASGRDGDLVFLNYQVNWVNAPYSTTSNSHGWEYVGYTHTSNYQSHILTCANPSAVTPTLVSALDAAQTIKYWDNAATNYTFTAVSAAKHLTDSKTDIENGYVTIQKNTTGSTVYDKGYKITATANADLSTLYISDRVSTSAKTSPVTLTFRNVLSQIRVGIYETIPGYEISSITFYVNTDGGSPTQTVEAKVSETKAFGAVCPNVKGTGYADYLTVTYGDGTTYIENHPIVTPHASSQNNLILGTNTSTLTTTGTPKYLGTTATNPTWDTDGGTFTTVFPQITNITNLALKCDYTLYNSKSKETINITGKTATVPAKYLQWKPNYKYSYLFKITDDDLSPITFDAVEIVAEDGTAEYITTVTEPSITTFGVTSTGAYSFGKDEYETGTDIYATFMQGATVLTPQLTAPTKANYVRVYSVDYKAGATTEQKAEKPITELSVANAIEHTGGLITATDVSSDASTYFTSAPSTPTSAPAEDGTTKTIDALKLEGVKAAGKYAVEIVTYEKLATKLTSVQSKVGYYSLSGDEYTKETSGNGDGSTDYYKQIKTYKVITVTAAP